VHQVTWINKIINGKSLLFILALMIAYLMGRLISHSDKEVYLLFTLLICCFVLLIFQFPDPIIFVLFLLSTENLQFIALIELPGFRLGPGLYFNLRDVLLILLFLSALYKLIKNSYLPPFTGPLTAIFTIALFSLGISVLTGTTTFSERHGLNLIRYFFAYSFFFSLITHMNSQAKVKRTIFFFILICVVASGIQVAEGLSGDKFAIHTSISAENPYFGTGAYILIGNEGVLYNWNRATPYTFFAMLLCYGASLFSNSYVLLVLPFLMFIGIAWGFSRIWYIMTAVGLLTMMILNFQSGKLRKLLVRTGLVIILIIIFMGITVPTATSPGEDLADLVWNRFLTVFQPTQDESFIGRTILIKEIWSSFLENPLIGLGFDPKNLNLDLGVMTTLSLLGLPGLVAILWLVLSMLKWAWRLQKMTTSPVVKGASHGIIASIFGILVGYSFSWDFFTRTEGIFLITFICYLIERGIYFYKNGTQPKHFPTYKNH
jgi:O-antigen ligase